jgi:hypothetical protein
MISIKTYDKGDFTEFLPWCWWECIASSSSISFSFFIYLGVGGNALPLPFP